MNRTSIRRLLDRGRKAGLNTTDLYRALSARHPATGDDAPGQADCNGYVPQMDSNGQRTYTPQAPRE